jgi:Flp pilus assembly pilin Flp
VDQFKLLVEYLRAQHRSDEGATIVEYSLLVALIAVALIGGLIALRGEISTLFQSIITAL